MVGGLKCLNGCCSKFASTVAAIFEIEMIRLLLIGLACVVGSSPRVMNNEKTPFSCLIQRPTTSPHYSSPSAISVIIIQGFIQG